MSATVDRKAARLLTAGHVRLEQFCVGTARALVHGDTADHHVTRTAQASSAATVPRGRTRWRARTSLALRRVLTEPSSED